MQDKIIDFNSCVTIFQPNLQRSFATISPIALISGPTNTLFYSWAGSATYTSIPSIAFGTIERWRTEPNDNLPLKRDQWIPISTGTPSLVRIVDVEKGNIPQHHSGSLPIEINADSPQWVRDLMQSTLDKCNSNE